MKALITGAAGFLGHNLIQYLLKEGCEIRAMKMPDDPAEMLACYKGQIEIMDGDVRDISDVEKAVEGCDSVFHLVGIISYWKKMNKLQYDVNVLGTRNVANACLKYNTRKLVYVSSTAACGIVPNGLADENTPYNLFPYRINYCDTKFLAEVEVLKACAHGLDASIICPGSMYGTGDPRRIKSDMIFNFKFPFDMFYFDGRLGVVDVEDVCKGMIIAWKNGGKGERYIMVSDNITFKEIRETIARALRKETPFIRLPSELLLILGYILELISDKKPKITPEMARITTIDYSFSNKKAKKELGIKFTPFKKTIERQVTWYKENGYL